ncbi:MAG: hypothetical protein DME98_07835 [Verrucomicrobia bacterium]|jgi:hypothetical protein|nr:MAG: hypothetical protein DME98_07835 [Verrucomicrobiota bacterium]PYJ35864.1 MAG: hypothetical protein DME88_00875 [Verrucomicrobiota bacterium]
MKDWEIIARNIKKRGWSLGYVSAIDSNGRTIWIVDAHRIICGHRMANAHKDRVAALINNRDLRYVQVQTAHPNMSTQTVVFREFA